MSLYRVIKDRKAPLYSPIKLDKNDKVSCGKEFDEHGDWPGWIWCTNGTRSSWVPKQIIRREGTAGVILEDYDATEHDIVVGEVIRSDLQLNGWIWGYKKDAPRSFGWAPLNHLERLDK